MRLKVFTLLTISFGFITLFFSNCDHKIKLDDTTIGLNSDTDRLSIDLIKKCDEAKALGKLRLKKAEILFEDPSKQCEWGKNENLQTLNGFIQARVEQTSLIELQEDAHVCQIELTNQDLQNFRYDDNLILTINDYILASTTNLNQHLTSRNGYFKYEWFKLRGKDAQNASSDTRKEKQYCAGQSEGYSQCLFPQTEQLGSIDINIGDIVLQTILGMTSPNKLKFSLVTTGDNDESDCQHVPLRFNLDILYF